MNVFLCVIYPILLLAPIYIYYAKQLIGGHSIRKVQNVMKVKLDLRKLLSEYFFMTQVQSFTEIIIDELKTLEINYLRW